jgi:hypothetical protein
VLRVAFMGQGLESNPIQCEFVGEERASLRFLCCYRSRDRWSCEDFWLLFAGVWEGLGGMGGVDVEVRNRGFNSVTRASQAFAKSSKIRSPAHPAPGLGCRRLERARLSGEPGESHPKAHSCAVPRQQRLARPT